MLNKNRSLERVKRPAADLSKAKEPSFAKVSSSGNVLPLAFETAET